MDPTHDKPPLGKGSKEGEGKPMSKRTAARLAAIQAVFQIVEHQNPLETVLADTLAQGALLEEDQAAPVNKELCEALVRGVVTQQTEVDACVRQMLREGWALERLDRVLRCILRVAAYEVIKDMDVETPILIREYINLTEAFYDDRQISFVHSSIHRLAEVA